VTTTAEETVEVEPGKVDLRQTKRVSSLPLESAKESTHYLFIGECTRTITGID